MSSQRKRITALDVWSARIERRLQLARGRLMRLRGAQVGQRFGLGRRVRMLYPAYFEQATM